MADSYVPGLHGIKERLVEGTPFEDYAASKPLHRIIVHRAIEGSGSLKRPPLTFLSPNSPVDHP